MLQFTDGDTLNGFFPKGTIGTVQGTYTYANGRKCIPFFEHSLQFKKATQLICFKHIIPAFRYVGAFENRIPHGQGTETYADGERYFPRLEDSLPLIHSLTYLIFFFSVTWELSRMANGMVRASKRWLAVVHSRESSLTTNCMARS